MKKKIFKYVFVFAFCISLLIAFFITKTTVSLYQEEIENKLQSEASYINFSLINAKSNTVNLDLDVFSKSAAAVEQRSDSNNPFKQNLRVTLIDVSGKVLGDSEADIKNIENHSDRKEVQEALKGHIGKDIRRSKTINVNLVYLALPANPYKIIVIVSMPLSRLNQMKSLFWKYAIVFTFIGGIFSFIISLIISQKITSPLFKMLHASNEIAAGKYTNRLQISEKDELGMLAEAFNDMTTSLEESITELSQKKYQIEFIINCAAVGIIAVDKNNDIIIINPLVYRLFDIISTKVDIGTNLEKVIDNQVLKNILSETTKKNATLEKEIFIKSDMLLAIGTSPIKTSTDDNENIGAIAFIQDITKLRKLETIRRDFVSNVTHELKTPIASIRGFIDTLKDGHINNPEIATRFLEIIDIETERLYNLICETLQLSEIESKKVDTDLCRVNVRQIVDQVFFMRSEVAREKNITLINNVDEALLIDFNPDRMKQMFINLVDNSINYNKIGGVVDVKGYNQYGMIFIHVIDSGIGIAKEHILRVFERFYRVDKSRAKKELGTGLGLAIVKHIVSLYNGDIDLKSEFDKGTEIIITFEN